MKTSANSVKTESETTSWMTFSSQIENGPPNCDDPMRLAGTWKQYSNQGDAPAEQYDSQHAEAFDLGFECDVAVPGERHEGVRYDEQGDGGDSFEHRP